MNISVVIPLFNKESLIQSCIFSIFEQSYLPSEIIIVNDGSTDSSLQKIQSFLASDENSKVKVSIINTPNRGVSAARNTGIKSATSDHIAFIDADDSWEKNYLQEMRNLILKYPEINIYSCNHSLNIQNIGKRIVTTPFPENFIGVIDFFEYASRYSVLNSSKVVIKKNILNKINGFPEGIKYGEDLYVWIKISSLGKVAFINKSLVLINQFTDNSRNSRNREVLYPLTQYTKKSVNGTPSLSSYLWILYRNSIMVKLKDSERQASLKTLLCGFNIFGAKALIFSPLFLLPNSLLLALYNTYKSK